MNPYPECATHLLSRQSIDLPRQPCLCCNAPQPDDTHQLTISPCIDGHTADMLSGQGLQEYRTEDAAEDPEITMPLSHINRPVGRLLGDRYLQLIILSIA